MNRTCCTRLVAILNLAKDQIYTQEQFAPLTLKPGEPLRLRVSLDRSVLEIFANGRQCITQRICPTRSDSLGVAIFSRGREVKVKSFDARTISPMNSW